MLYATPFRCNPKCLLESFITSTHVWIISLLLKSPTTNFEVIGRIKCTKTLKIWCRIYEGPYFCYLYYSTIVGLLERHSKGSVAYPCLYTIRSFWKWPFPSTLQNRIHGSSFIAIVSTTVLFIYKEHGLLPKRSCLRALMIWMLLPWPSIFEEETLLIGIENLFWTSFMSPCFDGFDPSCRRPRNHRRCMCSQRITALYIESSTSREIGPCTMVSWNIFTWLQTWEAAEKITVWIWTWICATGGTLLRPIFLSSVALFLGYQPSAGPSTQIPKQGSRSL